METEVATTVVSSPELVTTLLSYGLFGVLATAAVQFLKKTFKNVNILIILGGISLVGGTVYAVLMGTGYWEIVYQHALVIGGAANTIYLVLDQVVKLMSKGGNTLSRSS